MAKSKVTESLKSSLVDRYPTPDSIPAGVPDEPQLPDIEAPQAVEGMLTIRLKQIYRGRPSNEQPIFPGDYVETDARLFGLAHYLLQNGHAEIVK